MCCVLSIVVNWVAIVLFCCTALVYKNFQCVLNMGRRNINGKVQHSFILPVCNILDGLLIFDGVEMN